MCLSRRRVQVIYTDYLEAAQMYARKLREELHCDLVIALTHMRGPNDERLARGAPDVDLVLGGHDHDFFVQAVGVPSTMVGCPTTTTTRAHTRHRDGVMHVHARTPQVLKSGTDFRDLSELWITDTGSGPVPGEPEQPTCVSVGTRYRCGAAGAKPFWPLLPAP